MQRVGSAWVRVRQENARGEEAGGKEVDGEMGRSAEVGRIGRGVLVLLGVTRSDGSDDVCYMADKITGLRIFDDAYGKMNLSLRDVGGSMLAVSQFTLYGDCRRGKRPSFTDAAPPDQAVVIYHEFIDAVRATGVHVETGVFRAEMEVGLVNHGPVTIILDSSRDF